MSLMTRFLLITGLILTCWLGMMLTHESGHMLAAVLSGGAVERLEWPAWGFSRTDISPNPHPFLVALSGPLFGAAAPLLLALILRACRARSLVADIFSAFCLLANGAYLASGIIAPVGDAADILKCGSPAWLLWTIGLPLAFAGLAQLHALGPRLGFARASKSQTALAAIFGCLLLVASILWQTLRR
jgi:hypothetical protein